MFLNVMNVLLFEYVIHVVSEIIRNTVKVSGITTFEIGTPVSHPLKQVDLQRVHHYSINSVDQDSRRPLERSFSLSSDRTVGDKGVVAGRNNSELRLVWTTRTFS